MPDGQAAATATEPSPSLGSVWVVAALAALPALVSAVVSVGVDLTPASDYAPIEVRVRDVFSRHPPLVGAYSRVGANHPGPALFYALALPYRLLGSHPWALLTGAALINGAAIAATVRILGRGGRVGLAAAGAAATLVCAWGMGVEHLRDPWNPQLAVLPFLAAAVATWAVLTGSRRALPIAVGAMSFSLQAHVGYALVVGVLALGCAVGVGRHRDQWRSRPIPLLVGAVVLLAMWGPPVAEQVGDDGGNLTKIFREAQSTTGPAYGWTGPSDYMLPHLGPYPAWFRPVAADRYDLRGREGLTLPPLGLITFAAGALVALRRRQRDALALLALTLALWAAGAFSLTRLSGPPVPYLYRWIRPLGVLLWLAGLWPLTSLVAGRLGGWSARPGARVRGGVVAIVAVSVVAVGVSADQVRTPAFARYRAKYDRLDIVAERTVEAVRSTAPTGASVEVRTRGAVVYIAPAVVAALERSGHPTFVDLADGTVWGEHRLPRGRRASVEVVITDEAPASALLANPTMVIADQVELLGPRERVDLVRLTEAQGASCRSLPRPPECTDLQELESKNGTVTILLG